MSEPGPRPTTREQAEALWCVARGREIRAMEGHDPAVNRLARTLRACWRAERPAPTRPRLVPRLVMTPDEWRARARQGPLPAP